MAAAVVTSASTLEGQLVEVAHAIQSAEETAAAADSAFEPLLTIASDPEEGTITVTVSLPATVSGASEKPLEPPPPLRSCCARAGSLPRDCCRAEH